GPGRAAAAADRLDHRRGVLPSRRPAGPGEGLPVDRPAVDRARPVDRGHRPVRRRRRTSVAVRGGAVVRMVRAGDLMLFSWPLVLLSLLALPVLAAGYVLLIRRRRRRAVPYSSVALIRTAAPPRSAWRRHAPF